jgi:hypothetical protein
MDTFRAKYSKCVRVVKIAKFHTEEYSSTFIDYQLELGRICGREILSGLQIDGAYQVTVMEVVKS